MTEQNLLNAAKKIQTWIHTHPRKATIFRPVIEEFDKAIHDSEVKNLNIPDGIKSVCTSKKGCISPMNSEYFKDCIGCPKYKKQTVL